MKGKKKKYGVKVCFPDGGVVDSADEDDFFESPKAAEEWGEYMISCTRTGMEVFNLSNPGDYPLEDDDYYDDAEIIVYEITE